jgi:hypothetical protein
MADNRHLFAGDRNLLASPRSRPSLPLRFDPVWNSWVSLPTSLVSNWPLLFLRFNSYTLFVFRDSATICGVQRGVSSNVEVEHISDEEAVTVMSDHYGLSSACSTFF